MSLLYDTQYWRDRADEALAIAETLTTTEAREALPLFGRMSRGDDWRRDLDRGRLSGRPFSVSVVEIVDYHGR
jgi:hypothetical protein